MYGIFIHRHVSSEFKLRFGGWGGGELEGFHLRLRY